MLNQGAKDTIRERLNIADVIGEVVSLKPAGKAQLKGLCPFHSEKTPSFHVHVDRGFYYCFGCQAKGDVFDFVMQTQALSFPDALKVLGDRAGVEVTSQAPHDHKRRDLVAINQLASAFFRAALTREVTAYLRGRGLSDESLEEFE
ncbi:MAG TPA: CHC2 zinc finger domain-containing protein, partial [Trueperaceae bacterium]|nr:CHC2 zinc finger domain-containing protein [Trueperaceae bacterium]